MYTTTQHFLTTCTPTLAVLTSGKDPSDRGSCDDDEDHTANHDHYLLLQHANVREGKGQNTVSPTFTNGVQVYSWPHPHGHCRVGTLHVTLCVILV
ncbi:hypothetical protein GDO78_021997 [Eleutherodactylus coqui]|uniref:Uncharacterized protein n=1 Tax=Eleutherodactylus coqui TaxID=57060 RepID=A0A8J6JSC7_ELECQ|nr:hypothetical protein GDO78_021997 [Eleutherodactylus coqui]